MLWLLVFLSIKHFLLDFVYQPPYQWQNKGTYGHLGGIAHAGQHSLATLLLLMLTGAGSFGFALSIALGEFVVHYHMDWFKMWYNAKKSWKCNTHNEFWVLTGFDQLVHSLTYLGIAALV